MYLWNELTNISIIVITYYSFIIKINATISPLLLLINKEHNKTFQCKTSTIFYNRFVITIWIRIKTVWKSNSINISIIFVIKFRIFYRIEIFEHSTGQLNYGKFVRKILYIFPSPYFEGNIHNNFALFITLIFIWFNVR